MTTDSFDLSNNFGFLRYAEVELLKKTCEIAINDFVDTEMNIVNIGAGVGTSGLAFAEEIPNANRITIDISSGSPIGGMQNEKNAFRFAGIEHLLPKQIIGDSCAIGKGWETPIHMLFVDGSHSNESLLCEIQYYVPHIVPGGIVLYHDYCPKMWLSVVNIIDKWYNDNKSDFNKIEVAETLIAFRKDNP